MNKVFFFLIFCGMVFLSACDKYNYVYYIVENQSNDSIKIDYQYFIDVFDAELDSSSKVIGSNKEDTLFTFLVISPSVYDQEDEEVLQYLLNMEVKRVRDIAKTSKDVLLRSNWNYEETDDNFADFRLIIRDQDF